ncbi:S-layer homology domain-containing protein [Bacillus sp. HMF5848]|uniref:S-layer homology domain-containing protein n=1 Tax=Bacillus sp. HMF5848 TaxID=2495421 RepID=UPI000F77073C|nr:S-layer homology domain-containing protein [Bacillus sp. HMF5848]RSK28638.1 S-layer homology domain-containing protein [Bacillus sp. HMF5848]
MTRILYVILLLVVLAGCSTATTTAEDEVLEAATAPWVEQQFNTVETDIDEVDKQVTQLDKDIARVEAKLQDYKNTTFTDVPRTYEHYEAIMHLFDKKIISGYLEEKKFYPYRQLTRYQAASMLVSTLGLPLSKEEPVFNDVAGWPVEQIMATYENGIFQGSNGSFMPNQPMKRRHMAMVLVRAFGLEAPENAEFTSYNDVSETVGGFDAIKTITQLGIAKGSNGNFMPESPTTRAQFSAFIYRTLQYMEAQGVEDVQGAEEAQDDEQEIQDEQSPDTQQTEDTKKP